jgi:ABC-2 type transport system ATP-binding protein
MARLIEVTGLTKHFAGRPAIVDLTFTVPRGQVLGLLGSHGAGKSTTMRILAGCLSPTSGSVAVAGGGVNEWWRRSRPRLGYLPEGAPLDGEARVQTYLETMCALRGVHPPARRARVDQALEVCGIDACREDIIGRLPADMRRRVGLAQAVVHGPEVLVLDEPMTGLEHDRVTELRALVAELSHGRTVVVASRAFADVRDTCGRVLVIRQGRLAADDTPENVRRIRGEGAHREVVAVVRGDAAVLVRPLRRLAAVARVDLAEIGGGEHRLTVTGEGDDLQDGVARTIVRRGLELRELGSRDREADDVLTGVSMEDAS